MRNSLPDSCAETDCPPPGGPRCCGLNSPSSPPINFRLWSRRPIPRTARSASRRAWARCCSRGPPERPSTRAGTTTGRTTWRSVSRRRSGASFCCPTACAPRPSIPPWSERSSARPGCPGPGSTTRRARRRPWDSLSSERRRLNHHSARTELEPPGVERRNGQRLEHGQAAVPEAAMVHFFPGLVKVDEVGDIARGKLRKPRVEIPDAELVQQLQAIAGGIPLIAANLVEIRLAVAARCLVADLRRLSQEVPLHGMAKEMDQ